MPILACPIVYYEIEIFVPESSNRDTPPAAPAAQLGTPALAILLSKHYLIMNTRIDHFN